MENKIGRPKGTPKTGGRKKGTPNRVTGDLRSFINDLLESNRDQIIQDLQTVDASERLRIFEKLLSYAIPKKKDTNLTLIDRLSEDEMDNLINELAGGL